jgi:hypothetical protein
MDKNADEIELIILKNDKSNKVIAPRYRHLAIVTTLLLLWLRTRNSTE